MSLARALDGRPDQPPPVSIQLYSLRDASQRDFPAVIQTVASMGYAGVELAGLHGMKPREVRRLVEDMGMRISSSHFPWATPDNLVEVIEVSGDLGTPFMACGFPAESFASREAVSRTAETINLMEERLRSAGITLFLHNHWWEFETIDGRMKYDILLELAPRVSLEIDTYWAARFGEVDPAVVVRKFASRAPLLHIKDGPLAKGRPHVAVGAGKMDVPAVIGAADPTALAWLVVELDSCQSDMERAVRESCEYLVGHGLASGRAAAPRQPPGA